MSHILIVDDEPTICWALRECLTDEGYTVDIAGSAEQGLESAGRKPPDVVLLDVRLPGIDGLTALPEFHGSDSSVPVIVMTAFGSLSTAVQAIDQGAFDYLTKPLELDQVLTLVRQAESAARRRNPNDGAATRTHSPESDHSGGCDELITGPGQSHVRTLPNRTFREVSCVVFTNKEDYRFPNDIPLQKWRAQVSEESTPLGQLVDSQGCHLSYANRWRPAENSVSHLAL